MIEVKKLKFRYHTNESVPLSVDRLEIDGGLNLLFGRTGSGKTTLLRCFNGLIPHYYGGSISGRTLVEGIDTRENKPSSLSSLVGTVFQDPENQFLMLTVREEIAFALRNSGIVESQVDAEISEIARELGISDLLGRSIFELSSGQKQRVAIASALSAGPKYLLLDEPTSQLDAKNSLVFFRYIDRLCSRRGVTAVMSEHRIARSSKFCSRFIGMEDGHISIDGSHREMVAWFGERGISLPGRRDRRAEQKASARSMLDVSGLSVSYGGTRILEGVNLHLVEGEIVALLGENGSGKTTLLKAIMNFVKRDEGKVVIEGKDVSDTPSVKIAAKIGYLSHNPLNYLFQPTLEEELRFSNHHTASENGRTNTELMGIVDNLGLKNKLQLFPREFSCGERELAAISCTLSGGRSCLLLDEPTRGMDYWKKDAFLELLSNMCSRTGMSVLLATHDTGVVASWADRAYVLRNSTTVEMELNETLAV